jgi:hypothetical protein
MISFDWLTSDHRDTLTSERAAPQPRSLAWQPSPSPLRHVSSTLQYHSLSTPSPPLPLSPAVWSNLPIELVTQILLYAAFASRADAHALCLVSSAVRRAVLPALYYNVLLRSASQVPAFVSPFTAKQKRPPYHHYPSPAGHNNSSSNAKLLALIPIHALALALPTKRPSLEVALARTAPALASLEHLALTAPLLGAHAHWLRAAPHVRPRTLTLYHLGRPAPVNFGEPFLRNVTHLYTSTLCGFRGTSPASLPSLTHIALSARATQPPSVIDEVLAAARRMLSTCPHLVMLVLSLDSTGSTPTPAAIAASTAAAAAAATATSCSHGGIGTATPSIITLPVPWRAALARQRDPRLHVLPFALHARVMWRDIVASGEGSGVQDMFACAQAWRDAEARGATSVMVRLAAEAALRNAALDSWKEDEWDLDLMTAPGYVHGRSSDEGETDTRESPHIGLVLFV